MNFSSIWVGVACLLLELLALIDGREIEANLEDSDICDRGTPYILTDKDLLVGSLKPRRQALRRGTCILKVTASPGTIVIRTIDLNFQGCGDEILIFDQQKARVNPIYKIDCDSSLGVYRTHVDKAMIVFSKTDEASTSVLEFWVMTDKSECVHKECRQGAVAQRDTRETLTAAGIAGIVVSCVIVTAVVVGLVIYCVRFRRKEDDLHDFY